MCQDLTKPISDDSSDSASDDSLIPILNGNATEPSPSCKDLAKPIVDDSSDSSSDDSLIPILKENTTESLQTHKDLTLPIPSIEFSAFSNNLLK